MVKAASTWHFRGYARTSESVRLDAPRAVVHAILALSDEAPMYIGPAEP